MPTSPSIPIIFCTLKNRTRKDEMGTLGYFRKAKYCVTVAAAFGKERVTKGDLASVCRRVITPRSWSNSDWEHDIARSRAEEVSLAIKRVAVRLR